ncbi:hypothetical protein TNCV_1318971 [Trichonephila clavipes]|nr:hypothetical protein TNCV_1318971 [Trichonephila clavipes]
MATIDLQHQENPPTWARLEPATLGWIDGLEKDLVLKTKNWRILAGRRLAWKRLLGPPWAVESPRKEDILIQRFS